MIQVNTVANLEECPSYLHQPHMVQIDIATNLKQFPSYLIFLLTLKTVEDFSTVYFQLNERIECKSSRGIIPWGIAKRKRKQ
jgi:hypothetical protein